MPPPRSSKPQSLGSGYSCASCVRLWEKACSAGGLGECGQVPPSMWRGFGSRRAWDSRQQEQFRSATLCCRLTNEPSLEREVADQLRKSLESVRVSERELASARPRRMDRVAPGALGGHVCVIRSPSAQPNWRSRFFPRFFTPPRFCFLRLLCSGATSAACVYRERNIRANASAVSGFRVLSARR